jgi:uncharacterized membrane protein
MSRSIQISEITARIARDSRESLSRLYPDGEGEGAGDGADAVIRAWRTQSDSATVSSDRSGFVQTIALGTVASAAGPLPRQLRVVARPGDFVTSRSTLVEVWPGEAAGGGELTDAVRDAFSLGNERDLRQDALFGLRQLADIAVRALSPGVNDPTTAVTCLHHLQELLERLAALPLPDRLRRFGSAIVVVERWSFADALEPFSEIAAFAGGQPLVAPAVLDVLERVGLAARDAGYDDRARAAVEMAERVFAPLTGGNTTEAGRKALSARLAAIRDLSR